MGMKLRQEKEFKFYYNLGLIGSGIVTVPAATKRTAKKRAKQAVEAAGVECVMLTEIK